MSCFADGVREAARIYAQGVQTPNTNEMAYEIEKLHRAAEARRYQEVAKLSENLSTTAEDLLRGRTRRMSHSNAGSPSRPRVTVIGRNGEVLTRKPTVPWSVALPTSEDIRDESRRKHACATIAMLCRVGGRYEEGRRRANGKRSKTWRWVLYAPEKTTHPVKRSAEREFVGGLAEVWLRWTGKPPPRTADRRNLGPFARFVQECLRLVGAYHQKAAVAKLFNKREWCRRKMRGRQAEQIRVVRRKIVSQRSRRKIVSQTIDR
jgi:hypothetical protein